jgi:hypothetical protein
VVIDGGVFEEAGHVFCIWLSFSGRMGGVLLTGSSVFGDNVTFWRAGKDDNPRSWKRGVHRVALGVPV